MIEDLVKAEKSIKFIEESSRKIHELGNIELYELGQISRTVQCQACLKHIAEGLVFCALAAFVFDLTRNKYKESKPDSRL